MLIHQKKGEYLTNSRYLTAIYLSLPTKRDSGLCWWYGHSNYTYKRDCAYGSRDNILQTLDLPLPYLKKFPERT